MLGPPAAVYSNGPRANGALLITVWCRFSFAGFNAWLAWRSAYFTRLASMRNRINLLTNWTTTFIFGRDMSRF